MEQIRLRGHHIEFLVRRAYAAKYTPRIKKASSEHLANIYGKDFVRALEELENEIKPSTLVEAVAEHDDLCEKLDCVYKKECGAGDYQALSRKMMKKVPVFLISLPILISKTLSKEMLEKEDAAILREYGLKPGDVRPFGLIMKQKEKEYVK